MSEVVTCPECLHAFELPTLLRVAIEADLRARLEASAAEAAEARRLQEEQAQQLRQAESTLQKLYDYLSGPEFRARIQGSVEAFQELQHDLLREQRALKTTWHQRERQLGRALENLTAFYGDIRGIAGRQLPLEPIEALELPYREDEDLEDDDDQGVTATPTEPAAPRAQRPVARPAPIEPPMARQRPAPAAAPGEEEHEHAPDHEDDDDAPQVALPGLGGASRETDAALEALLMELVLPVGSVGNTSLFRELVEAARRRLDVTVTEEDYWRCRDALVHDGRLRKGKGRGGSVLRADAPTAPTAPTPPTPPTEAPATTTPPSQPEPATHG